MLELMLAISLLGLVTFVTYLGFSTVTTAWQRGTSLADKLHHGDFIMEQLVMGLRSMYYPATGLNPDYGFQFSNHGDGPRAADVASWVKLGSALVGKDSPYAGGPHRVQVTLEKETSGSESLAVRSWGLLSQVEGFESDKLPAVPIAAHVVGINFRFQEPKEPAAPGSTAVNDLSDEIKWMDDWEDTNRIPQTIELTVYMEPLEKNGDEVEIKRIVEIPVAPLAWR